MTASPSKARDEGWAAILAPALLVTAVAYIAVTTIDVELVGVPLKIPLVAVALSAWLVERRRRPRPKASFAFGWLVVLAAVVVPAVWFGVALLRMAAEDPAQREGTFYAFQQGSRFVYLLLYFPFSDWLARYGQAVGSRLWMAPVFLLCGVTWGLFLGYALLGFDYGYSGQVGPFKGSIGPDGTGQFRDYVINHVLLIPAVIFTLALVLAEGLTPKRTAAVGFLLGTTYLSHTRGIWLGIGVGALAMVTFAAARPRARWLRRAVAGVLAVALLLAFIGLTAPSVVDRTFAHLRNTRELSLIQRLDQEPALWKGIRRHVVIGSGLGATLPSGHVRSAEAPWSFELTYLQLWFQLGFIGLAATLAAALWALIRCFQVLRTADGPTRPLGYAAIGGLLGTLFTFGGNPYLMTSVGTMALAILLAMADSFVRGETHGASPSADRLRTKWATAPGRGGRPQTPC